MQAEVLFEKNKDNCETRTKKLRPFQQYSKVGCLTENNKLII